MSNNLFIITRIGAKKGGIDDEYINIWLPEDGILKSPITKDERTIHLKHGYKERWKDFKPINLASDIAAIVKRAAKDLKSQQIGIAYHYAGVKGKQETNFEKKIINECNKFKINFARNYTGKINKPDSLMRKLADAVKSGNDWSLEFDAVWDEFNNKLVKKSTSDKSDDVMKILTFVESKGTSKEEIEAFLVHDQHIIQNKLQLRGDSKYVIKFIEGALLTFQLSPLVQEQANTILCSLNKSSWKKDASNITDKTCDFLNTLYREVAMKEHLMVIDDQVDKNSPLTKNFFNPISSRLGYGLVFVKKPQDVENKINQYTKFVFLDVEFKNYSPNTVNELREKIKPIPYIIFSNHPQKPMERLDTKIRESVGQLLSLLREFKKKKKIEDGDLTDLKYTIDNVGRLEKEDIIDDIEDDLKILPVCKNEKINKTLSSLLKDIKDHYPDDIYPDIKRCVAYIEKKDLERNAPYIEKLIQSTLKSSSDDYCIRVNSKNRVITITEGNKPKEICDVSLNKNEWAFFNKCFEAYPNAADFKTELEELPKAKKAKFYDIKYQIEKNIKEKSKGCITGIFERVGKGLFKLSIQPETGAIIPVEVGNDHVTRGEFNALQNDVNEILSILKSQTK